MDHSDRAICSHSRVVLDRDFIVVVSRFKVGLCENEEWDVISIYVDTFFYLFDFVPLGDFVNSIYI